MSHIADKTKHVDLAKVADELAHFLADTYALYLKTQNYHWNIEGSYFYSLHKMFEEQYQELADAIDEIAERIRALGGRAPGSFSRFAQLASIKDENETPNAETMLKNLMRDHEILIQQALDIISKAQQAHDEGTADMLIQRSKSHQKVVWMLRSSLKV